MTSIVATLLLAPVQTAQIDSKKILDEIFHAFTTNNYRQYTLRARADYELGKSGSSLRYGFAYFVWSRAVGYGFPGIPKEVSLPEEPGKAMRRAFDSFPNDHWVRIAYTEYVSRYREPNLPQPKVVSTEVLPGGQTLQRMEWDYPLNDRLIELSKRTLKLALNNAVAKFQLARTVDFTDA